MALTTIEELSSSLDSQTALSESKTSYKHKTKTFPRIFINKISSILYHSYINVIADTCDNTSIDIVFNHANLPKIMLSDSFNALYFKDLKLLS